MKKTLAGAALLTAALTGCLDIEDLVVPSRALVGETFTLTATLRHNGNSGPNGDPWTPGFCLRIPPEWELGALTYNGENDGATYAGTADYNASMSSNANSSASTSEGTDWRCFSSPAVSDQSTGFADISLPVTVTTKVSVWLGFMTLDSFGFNEAVEKAFLTPAAVETQAIAQNHNPFFPSVTRDDNKFVAAGSDGELYQSANGRTWSSLPSPGTDVHFKRIRYAAGRYIAIVRTTAMQEFVWESTDLTTWNEVSADWVYSDIISDGSTIVMLGNGGYIGVYTEASGWTFPKISDSDWSYGAWGEGRFVIGAYDGTVSSSTDAVEWDALSTAPNTVLGMAWGNDTFVMVGNGFAWYSTDGLNFSTISGFSNAYNGVYFAGDTFLLSGDQQFTSTDGINWTRVGYPTVRDAVSIGEKTVIAGDDKLYYHAPVTGRLDTEVYDYGKVATGSTGRKQFALTNTGTGDLYAGAISGGSENFRLENDNCSNQWVDALSQCTFDVVFDADTLGVYDASWEVPLEWPAAVTLTIDVSAELVEAPPEPEPGDEEDNAAPMAPSLLSPADGASDLDTTVDFRWSESTDADGDAVTYELTVCDNEDFSGCQAETVTASTAPLQQIPGALVWPAVMFGAVLLRKRKELLLVFALLLTPLLPACGADTVVDQDKKVDVDDDVLEGIGKTVTGLQPGTTYWWKVTAVDARGARAESSVRSFSTK